MLGHTPKMIMFQRMPAAVRNQRFWSHYAPDNTNECCRLGHRQLEVFLAMWCCIFLTAEMSEIISKMYKGVRRGVKGSQRSSHILHTDRDMLLETEINQTKRPT